MGRFFLWTLHNFSGKIKTRNLSNQTETNQHPKGESNTKMCETDFFCTSSQPEIRI